MTYLHHQSAAVKKKAGGQIPCSCSYGKAYQQQLKHTTRLLLATDKLNPPHGVWSKACCFTAVFAGRVLNPGCVRRLTSGVCVCFSVFPTEERKKVKERVGCGSRQSTCHAHAYKHVQGEILQPDSTKWSRCVSSHI